MKAASSMNVDKVFSRRGVVDLVMGNIFIYSLVRIYKSKHLKLIDGLI